MRWAGLTGLALAGLAGITSIAGLSGCSTLAGGGRGAPAEDRSPAGVAATARPTVTSKPAANSHPGAIVAATPTPAVNAGEQPVTVPPLPLPSATTPTTSDVSGTPAPPGRPGPGRRPGGYYLDDGPEDQLPPIDFLAVPDAVPTDIPFASGANRPYEALGEVYFPDTSGLPFSERGIASWYGKRFHGHKTSSGERYDMYGMTAAHKTLPIPSFARVTHVATGKSVIVRINDRGPFAPGRVIDLSYTAAAKLGILARGSAEVVVERALPGEVAGSAPATPTGTIASPGSTASASATVPTGTVAAIGTGAAADSTSTIGTAIPANNPARAASTSEAATGPATSTETPQRGWGLQLGAFRDAANAERLLARARSALPDLASLLQVVKENGLHKVSILALPDPLEQSRLAGLVSSRMGLQPRLLPPR